MTTSMTTSSTDEIEYLRDEALLTVRHLVQRYRVSGGTIEAVADISFDIRRGEILGLVGESGCGKSTTGRAVLQLPRPSAGEVWFDDAELTAGSTSDIRRMRPNLQMIFQDPSSALNPRRKVRDIVAEGLTIAGTPSDEIAARVATALEHVGLDPDIVGDRKPHEFSGGQCQRIAIARAMVLRPKLIVCDEPVASLDVSVQGQVLNTLLDLRDSDGLSLLFISHDLMVVRALSDRVAVMYLGRIVEIGEADRVYRDAAHPYTKALIAAVPTIGETGTDEQDISVKGEVPSLLDLPSGCRFRLRCPIAQNVCATETPQLRRIGEDHFVACHFPAGGFA